MTLADPAARTVASPSSEIRRPDKAGRLEACATTVISRSPAATRRLGEAMGRMARLGDVIGLVGPLGAGKTEMVKGIAQGMGIGETVVTSPTFVLMQIYDGKIPLYHIDLYRWAGDDVGLDDAIFGDGVVVIEWADRSRDLSGRDLLPPDRLWVTIRYTQGKERAITVTRDAPDGGAWIRRMEQTWTTLADKR